MRAAFAVVAMALLAVVAAADARAAQPRVVAAYAYFHPAGGKLAKRMLGTVELVFRTSRRIGYTTSGQLEMGTSIGGQAAVAYTISRRYRCYGSAAVVERDGTISAAPGRNTPVAVGWPVQVQIGSNVEWLDRRFVVGPERGTSRWGRALGCRPERRPSH